MNFPLDSDDKMETLKASISLQNTLTEEEKQDLDFYKMKNPLYNYNQMFILIKTEHHKQTKIVVDHFQNISYLNSLYLKEYSVVKNKLITIIVTWILVFIFFFTILIVTFRYLEVKALSLIPLLSLFMITIAAFILIINGIRFIVINKVIRGEYYLDMKLLRLFIYQMKRSEEEEKEKSGILSECARLAQECGES
jgi:hypothetical protein